MALATKVTRLTTRAVPPTGTTNGSAGQFDLVLSAFFVAVGPQAAALIPTVFGMVTNGYPTGELT